MKVTVTLEKLKLTGGAGTKFDLDSRYGGGVYSGDGAVTHIVDCLIADNTALEGGGVYHNDGTMTITGSTITGNRSDEAGGGVYVNTDAVLTMTRHGIHHVPVVDGERVVGVITPSDLSTHDAGSPRDQLSPFWKSICRGNGCAGIAF